MNEFYAMLVQKDCVVALFRPSGAQYGLMLRLFRPGGLNTARARALCSLCSIRARFVGYVLTGRCAHTPPCACGVVWAF